MSWIIHGLQNIWSTYKSVQLKPKVMKMFFFHKKVSAAGKSTEENIPAAGGPAGPQSARRGAEILQIMAQLQNI